MIEPYDYLSLPDAELARAVERSARAGRGRGELGRRLRPLERELRVLIEMVEVWDGPGAGLELFMASALLRDGHGRISRPCACSSRCPPSSRAEGANP